MSLRDFFVDYNCENGEILSVRMREKKLGVRRKIKIS